MDISNNSSVSDFQSPTRTPSRILGQQINQFGCNSWKKQEINSSQSIDDSSNNGSSIIEPRSDKMLDIEPELDLDQPQIQMVLELKSLDGQDKEQGIKKKSESSSENQDNNSDPKTQTLVEDDLMSRESWNFSSRISQYNSEVDRETYASFLSIRQSSYEGIIRGFQILFQNMHNLFEQRLELVENSYLQFLKIKNDQAKAQNSITNLRKISSRYNKNQVVFADCEGTTNQIMKNIKCEYQTNLGFAMIVEESYNTMSRNLIQIKTLKDKKETQIRKILEKIQFISQEMTDLMIPKNRKQKKKQVCKKLFLNSYVRTKYLMAQQKNYLFLMGQFLKKVIKYISILCLELQPKMCLITKQVLLTYFEGIEQWKPDQKITTKKSITKLQSLNCFSEIYKQNIEMLEISTPPVILGRQKIIYNQQSNLQYGEQLHKIIEHLISETQSLVYLPCIQIQSKDYVYNSKNKAKVFWKKINPSQRINHDDLQSEEAQIIITEEGHLVIQLQQEEIGERVALLKLSEIKISRRDKDLIIIDKGKGVIGYLLNSKSILGYIRFQPLENTKKITETRDLLIDQFADIIKQTLEIRKQYKQRLIPINPISLLKRKYQQ